MQAKTSDNIKVDTKEIGWFLAAQGKDYWQSLPSMVINLRELS
jgi:hypothetical protein